MDPISSVTKTLEIFGTRTRNTGNLSHFHGIRILISSWTRVTSMPDGGPRRGWRSRHYFRAGSVDCRCYETQNLTTETLCQRQTRVHFMYPEVVREFSRLHENFVIVPADKAANNYTFVCKRCCVSILIEELGLNSLLGNPTYNLTYFFCIRSAVQLQISFQSLHNRSK